MTMIERLKSDAQAGTIFREFIRIPPFDRVEEFYVEPIENNQAIVCHVRYQEFPASAPPCRSCLYDCTLRELRNRIRHLTVYLKMEDHSGREILPHRGDCETIVERPGAATG